MFGSSRVKLPIPERKISNKLYEITDCNNDYNGIEKAVDQTNRYLEGNKLTIQEVWVIPIIFSSIPSLFLNVEYGLLVAEISRKCESLKEKHTRSSIPDITYYKLMELHTTLAAYNQCVTAMEVHIDHLDDLIAVAKVRVDNQINNALVMLTAAKEEAEKTFLNSAEQQAVCERMSGLLLGVCKQLPHILDCYTHDEQRPMFASEANSILSKVLQAFTEFKQALIASAEAAEEKIPVLDIEAQFSKWDIVSGMDGVKTFCEKTPAAPSQLSLFALAPSSSEWLYSRINRLIKNYNAHLEIGAPKISFSVRAKSMVAPVSQQAVVERKPQPKPQPVSDASTPLLPASKRDPESNGAVALDDLSIRGKGYGSTGVNSRRR